MAFINCCVHMLNYLGENHGITAGIGKTGGSLISIIEERQGVTTVQSVMGQNTAQRGKS